MFWCLLKCSVRPLLTQSEPGSRKEQKLYTNIDACNKSVVWAYSWWGMLISFCETFVLPAGLDGVKSFGSLSVRPCACIEAPVLPLPSLERPTLAPLYCPLRQGFVCDLNKLKPMIEEVPLVGGDAMEEKREIKN